MQTTIDQTLYPSPFSAGYWRSAVSQLGRAKILVAAALLLALEVILGLIIIRAPLMAYNLQIKFTYLATSAVGVVCGPVVGMVYGVAVDLVDIMLHPEFGFFPGYTLSSFLCGLFYGLFLYRAKITLPRVLLCKLSVNLLINVCLGSLWSAIMMGKAYIFYFSASIVKNMILWIPESLLIFAFLKLLLPILTRENFIPKQLFPKEDKVKAG